MRQHFEDLGVQDGAEAEKMNTSHQFQNDFPVHCVYTYSFIDGKPDHLSDLPYAVLVALIVIHATTCPFAIVWNLLVMIAVKTKARLQSMSNITLSCLASTDVMVGLVVQPLLIAQMVNLIQGETTAGACSVQSATGFFITFCFSSAVHLFLITVDRYIAIMRPYIYIQTVTKTRVLIATALAWTLSVIVHIVSLIDEELFRTIISVVVVSLVAIIVICNLIVYREVHRHEKQIAAQQVDVATRENFLSQKRAFKLTLTIIALLVISFLPVFIFRRLKELLKSIVSFGTLSCIFMAVYSLSAFIVKTNKINWPQQLQHNAFVRFFHLFNKRVLWDGIYIGCLKI